MSNFCSRFFRFPALLSYPAYSADVASSIIDYHLFQYRLFIIFYSFSRFAQFSAKIVIDKIGEKHKKEGVEGVEKQTNEVAEFRFTKRESHISLLL